MNTEMSFHLFGLFYLMVGASTFKNSPQNLIIDISKNVKLDYNISDLDRDIVHAFRSANSKNQTYLMYYEAESQDDLSQDLEKLEYLFAQTQKHFKNFKSKLLILLKDFERNSFKNRDLIQLIVNHASIIAGFSIEVSNANQFSSKSNNDFHQNFIVGIKKLLKEANSETISVGYVLGYKDISCSGCAENIMNADYIIINIPLKLDDKLFIESYGMLKKLLDKISHSIKKTKSFSNINKIYCRISLSNSADLNQLVVCKRDKYKNGWTNCYYSSNVNQALKQTNSMSLVQIERYHYLVSEHIITWANDMKNSNNFAIISSDHYTNKRNQDLGCINSNSGIILYFENLPSENLIGSKSAAVNYFKNVIESGFDKIMTKPSNLGIFKNGKSIPQDGAKCPINRKNGNLRQYSEDTKSFYDIPHTDGDKITSTCYKCGYFEQDTNLTTFFRYNKNNFIEWNQAAKQFKPPETFNGNLFVANSQCNILERLYQFQNCSGGSEKLQPCFGLLIPELPECKFCVRAVRSDPVLEVNFSFINDKDINEDVFHKKIMAPLNAIRIAREVLKVDYPERTLYLQIKREPYTGEELTLPSMYCNKVRETISQFYDAVLTWAKIHDFPVVVEVYHNRTLDFGNPLAWERLQYLSAFASEQVIASKHLFPLFVRRRYNQSKVLGNWTNGAYPCIQKTVKLSKIVYSNLIFDQFFGITFNLNLRFGQVDPLRSDEIQMLLLLSFKRFHKVNLIIEEKEINGFVDVICSDYFRRNLEHNGINRGAKIYFQVKNFNSISKEQLTNITLALRKINFDVQVMYHFDDIKNSNVNALGLVHPNCARLAENIVDAKDEDLKNILEKTSSLICETEQIYAINENGNDMQNYLDSHLYLTKLIRLYFPNITEIHFRLNTLLAGKSLEEETNNLLMLLLDLQNYANTYKINYFFIVAFAQTNTNFTSFWKITDYTNLTDPSVFQDIEAQFFGKDTWTPEIKCFPRIEQKSTTAPNTGQMAPVPNQMILENGQPTPKYGEITPKTEHMGRINGQTTPAFYPWTPKYVPVTLKDVPVTLKDVSVTQKYVPTTPEYVQTTQKYDRLMQKHDQSTPNYDHSKPKHSTEANSEIFELPSQAFYTICATVALLVILIIVLLICSWRRSQYLTSKEIREFERGRFETLSKAASVRDGRKLIGNIFDGLVYQKDFEMTKYSLDFSTKQFIAKGSYSKLFRVKLEGSRNSVALKIPRKKCPKEIFKGLLSEVKLLCYIGNHSNIVGFLGCYSKEIGKGILWIVTEFCDGGSLLDYLKDLKAKMDVEWSGQDLVRFAGEIACGMEHIGNQNAVHGDLCAKHVLLDCNQTCKISGFRLSRKLKEYQNYVRSGQQTKMAWQWMAPEVLKKLEFSNQSDVWSYGVTLWEIFSLGDSPYPGVTWKSEFVNDIANGVRMNAPAFATRDIYDEMIKCWNVLPDKRQTFAELVEYFNDFMPQKPLEK